MVGEALDVGGGDSDRAASYQEQMSHQGQTEKNSVRANAFRVTPESGITQCSRDVSNVPEAKALRLSNENFISPL
jgi:hypothetical protein